MKCEREMLLAILLGMILPMLLLKTIRSDEKRIEPVYVKVLTADGAIEMDIEEYLVGVLLKEMPASFEIEAMKAQAVAARSYTIYNVENGTKHNDAHICVLPNCCQGYVTPHEFLSVGNDPVALIKICNAVRATRGQVLLFDNSVIEATYFSASGGRTEDAQAVWGVDIPYLQSVDSEEDDAAHIKTFTFAEFCKSLDLSTTDVSIGDPVYTKGQGIEEVEINGTVYTGIQLRKYLDLRSTCITFSVDGGEVKVITYGFGHRVGMSQYGADAMAARGCGYKQILEHYYSGVNIGSYYEGGRN